ncbi:processed acidic surface protein [Bacillus sp. AFS073361]|uniref:processed acidic surface protein n=1 Tax=Bacillus sp. AFS073361 TaxID=2033511 RepID=UPI000BF387FF|nr:processed acidic surface protein [Bacillus sp. AFS073361]PFP28620.1 processed acidic surface protein [Bacillus sp. AFS073361]
MVKIKLMLIGFLLLPFLFSASSAQAAPSENEINKYIADIGWTKQEFLEYIDYYEIPLDEYTMAGLKELLGPPINSKNYQDLLIKYGLTEKELNDLMDHFGDSVKEYKFINDLDSTVEFYISADKSMAEVEKALSDTGITEEEAERFFNYLAEVEEKNKDQLDQMTTNDTLWEHLMTVEDPSQLSDEDLDEMVRLLEQTIALYEVKVNFKADGKAVTLKDLLKMKEPPGTLYGSIYSTSGELLIDFNIPREYFESMEAIVDGEDMIHLGEISDDYVDHMHEEKYEDARKGLK